MANSAQTLINAAVAAGFDRLSDRDLMECLLYAAQAGGGGIPSGNYAGVAPTFTPSSGTGLAIDSSTGRLWMYYNGAWH